MFILIVDYLKPLNEVETYLPAHRAYLKKYYDQGLFICSGRQIPPRAELFFAERHPGKLLKR